MTRMNQLHRGIIGIILAALGFCCAISANPALTVGTWVNISPSNVSFGNGPFTQGMAVDPSNPSTIYLCVSGFDISLAGLFKTTDAGSTWRRIGHVPTNWTGRDMIDEPIRIRVDPSNSNHLYCGDGVRGNTGGFWVSNDGGENWTTPQGYSDLAASTGSIYDVYSVAVDPTDFNHILVSSHSAWKWGDAAWGNSSGVLESKDGGTTWIVHAPNKDWGTGHSISFLYDPANGIGNSETWLLGTQGPGYWRTTNSGTTWTQVNPVGIQHGGGTVYYTKAGVLYASGAESNLRSTNNGVTWTNVGPGGGYNCIYGDGTRLYTLKCFGPEKFQTSLETDGTTWTAFNNQSFESGPFEMELDKTNQILYTASWGSGIWALKLPATGVERTSHSKILSTSHSAVHASKIVLDGSASFGKTINHTALFDIRGRVAAKSVGSRQLGIVR